MPGSSAPQNHAIQYGSTGLQSTSHESQLIAFHHSLTHELAQLSVMVPHHGTPSPSISIDFAPTHHDGYTSVHVVSPQSKGVPASHSHVVVFNVSNPLHLFQSSQSAIVSPHSSVQSLQTKFPDTQALPSHCSLPSLAGHPVHTSLGV